MLQIVRKVAPEDYSEFRESAHYSSGKGLKRTRNGQGHRLPALLEEV